MFNMKMLENQETHTQKKTVISATKDKISSYLQISYEYFFWLYCLTI